MRSSLDKEESLTCQITSPFNKKIESFERQSFNFYLKTTQLIVECAEKDSEQLRGEREGDIV